MSKRTAALLCAVCIGVLMLFGAVSCTGGEIGRERLDELVESKLPRDVYTAASYAAYDEAYSRALELSKKENITALEIDKAVDEVNAAKDKLVKKADFSQLKLAIDAHDSIDQKNYTSDSYAVYYAAYEKAKEVYGIDTSKQSEINSAVTALNNAIKGLVRVADRTVLRELTERYIEKGAYTTASYKNYEEAYTNALQLLKDESASTSALLLAENVLREAIDRLVERADTAPLEEKLNAIKETYLANDKKGRAPEEYYAQTGYKTVCDVVGRAEEALQTGDVSANDISLLCLELDDAAKGLVNLSSLLDTYELASTYTPDDVKKQYTEDSFRTLSSAMVVAYNVMKTPSVTADEVKDAVDYLETAIASMERIQVISDGALDKNVGGFVVKVGKSSVRFSDYLTDYSAYFVKVMSENADFAFGTEGDTAVFTKGKVKVLLSQKNIRIEYKGASPVAASDLSAVSFGGFTIGDSEFDIAAKEGLGDPTTYATKTAIVGGKENKIAVLTYENEAEGLKLTFEYNTIGNYIVSVELECNKAEEEPLPV